MDQLIGNPKAAQKLVELPDDLKPIEDRLKAYKGWINGPLYDRYAWQSDLRNRVCRPMADAEPSLPRVIDASVDPVYYSECQDG